MPRAKTEKAEIKRKKKISQTEKKQYKDGRIGGMEGKCHSEKTKQEMSENRKGEGNSFYGKHHSEESKEKNRQASLGQIPWNRDKIGVYSEKTLKKMSSLKKDKYIGKNNPAWKGGISFEPYTPEFNNQLKHFIRERDNNICQFCGKIKEENNQELSVNHINYIKEDCRPRNLIALCRVCNIKANTERDKWELCFIVLQELRGI